eukprot:6214744-Pleurochrysis_carterae.AAC.4
MEDEVEPACESLIEDARRRLQCRHHLQRRGGGPLARAEHAQAGDAGGGQCVKLALQTSRRGRAHVHRLPHVQPDRPIGCAVKHEPRAIAMHEAGRHIGVVRHKERDGEGDGCQEEQDSTESGDATATVGVLCAIGHRHRPHA